MILLPRPIVSVNLNGLGSVPLGREHRNAARSSICSETCMPPPRLRFLVNPGVASQNIVKASPHGRRYDRRLQKSSSDRILGNSIVLCRAQTGRSCGKKAARSTSATTPHQRDIWHRPPRPTRSPRRGDVLDWWTWRRQNRSRGGLAAPRPCSHVQSRIGRVHSDCARSRTCDRHEVAACPDVGGIPNAAPWSGEAAPAPIGSGTCR